MSTTLTHERLLQVLDYNPALGLFWRREKAKRLGGNCVEAIAGGFDGEGYIKIGVDGRQYRAHRLAWFYVTGEWPEDLLDHDNGYRGDNAFVNLRPADNFLNQANRPQHMTRDLPKGVSRANGRFVARIRHKDVHTYIGRFDTADEAHEAYMAAARRIHGDYANFAPKRRTPYPDKKAGKSRVRTVVPGADRQNDGGAA